MFGGLVALCVMLLLVTAVIHSIGGERHLIKPMFHQGGSWVLDNALARLALAVILYALAYRRDNLTVITLGCVCAVFTAVDLFNLIASRARHIGWPFLLLTGLSAFAALLSGRPLH